MAQFSPFIDSVLCGQLMGSHFLAIPLGHQERRTPSSFLASFICDMCLFAALLGAHEARWSAVLPPQQSLLC
jgi:hypothetical protein